MNKFNFNEQELLEYLRELSPAELGCVSKLTTEVIEYVIDMHFEQHNSISLIEFLSLVSMESVNKNEMDKE